MVKRRRPLEPEREAPANEAQATIARLFDEIELEHELDDKLDNDTLTLSPAWADRLAMVEARAANATTDAESAYWGRITARVERIIANQ